jgi:PIN domain nuclease of toxin-antitoxin system
MRYLIDTNIFIRITDEYDAVAKNVKDILDDYENMIYVSSESIKEYVHLVQEKRIIPKKDISVDNVFDFIENTLGFKVKYVAKEHLQYFARLETVEGHIDPSDRLIISQALTERMPLISSDTKFPKYRKQGLQLIVNR